MVQISLTTLLALAATVQGACNKGPAINGKTVDLIKEFEGFVASPSTFSLPLWLLSPALSLQCSPHYELLP